MVGQTGSIAWPIYRLWHHPPSPPSHSRLRRWATPPARRRRASARSCPRSCHPASAAGPRPVLSPARPTRPTPCRVKPRPPTTTPSTRPNRCWASSPEHSLGHAITGVDRLPALTPHRGHALIARTLVVVERLEGVLQLRRDRDVELF